MGKGIRFSDLDMKQKVAREPYEEELAALQARLSIVQQAYLFSGDSAVIVFEGWDAGGKGGTIRRLSAVLDPRGYKVWPIGAPRPYYLERHFLARFMERLPPNGGISVFDRSWYGRVLVERVEGFTPPKRWKAAFREIRDFERMLIDDGTRIVKIFMHIDKDEQLRRFEKRLRDPTKRWKLSYEDFRNRGRWDDYIKAAEEMFEKTSRPGAPWTVIPANDKKFARLTAIRTIVACLEKDVDLEPPPVSDAVLREAEKVFQLSPGLVESLAGRTD